ncbi:hypothetical protein F4779DRAFT_601140 [Xylariaceae sp. FL0662B]|nr:hypothetical protein F4779DRAFT_601140 [Xylariaceae sp. FL0662B]
MSNTQRRIPTVRPVSPPTQEDYQETSHPLPSPSPEPEPRGRSQQSRHSTSSSDIALSRRLGISGNRFTRPQTASRDNSVSSIPTVVTAPQSPVRSSTVGFRDSGFERAAPVMVNLSPDTGSVPNSDPRPPTQHITRSQGTARSPRSFNRSVSPPGSIGSFCAANTMSEHPSAGRQTSVPRPPPSSSHSPSTYDATLRASGRSKPLRDFLGLMSYSHTENAGMDSFTLKLLLHGALVLLNMGIVLLGSVILWAWADERVWTVSWEVVAAMVSVPITATFVFLRVFFRHRGRGWWWGFQILAFVLVLAVVASFIDRSAKGRFPFDHPAESEGDDVSGDTALRRALEFFAVIMYVNFGVLGLLLIFISIEFCVSDKVRGPVVDSVGNRVTNMTKEQRENSAAGWKRRVRRTSEYDNSNSWPRESSRYA